MKGLSLMEDAMDRVYSTLPAEVCMRVNSKTIISVDMEFSNLLMLLRHIKEPSKRVNSMALVH